MTESLSADTKATLLRYARETVTAAAEGAPPGPPPTGGALDEPAGVFVTLRRSGELRGCLGRTRPDRVLGQLVGEMARDAATRDPRFPPVRPAELADLTIEISRLTPMVESTAEAVEPGRHGVVVRRGSYVGLLLPQVAVEFNCSASEFLDLACRKAGLDPGAWREADVTIDTFEAEIFAE